MNLEDAEYWKSLINMSLTRFLILRTLQQAPCHGYAILERLEKCTQGCCSPTYGGIYPILKELLLGGYARVRPETVGGRKRRVYEATAKGLRAYETAKTAWRDVLPFLTHILEESYSKGEEHR